MSAHQKKKYSRRINSQSSNNRLIIYVVVLIAIVVVVVNTPNPLLKNSASVLGINNLFARGGEESANSGSGNSQVEDEHERDEIKISEDDEIRVEITDDKGKIEIRSGVGKTKIEAQSKIEDEQEDEDEDEDISEDEIEIEIEDEVEIATDGGSFSQNKKHLGAKSHFPISIDPLTNSLIITTPSGIKTVAILPDRAVQNILTLGILSKIEGGIASGSAEVDSENVDITLTEKDGEAVYRVEGEKEKKFFGLIPIAVNKAVVISAESGEFKSTEIDLFNRFLDLFSL